MIFSNNGITIQSKVKRNVAKCYTNWEHRFTYIKNTTTFCSHKMRIMLKHVLYSFSRKKNLIFDLNLYSETCMHGRPPGVLETRLSPFTVCSVAVSARVFRRIRSPRRSREHSVGFFLPEWLLPVVPRTGSTQLHGRGGER